jgi:acetyl-CoA carboxylase carboxyltransferase component
MPGGSREVCSVGCRVTRGNGLRSTAVVSGTWAGTHTMGRANFSHHGVHNTVTQTGIKDRSPCVGFTQSGGTRTQAGTITHSAEARTDTTNAS